MSRDDVEIANLVIHLNETPYQHDMGVSIFSIIWDGYSSFHDPITQTPQKRHFEGDVLHSEESVGGHM